MKRNYSQHKINTLAIGLLLALTASVSAAPGDLDLSFGGGGIIVTSIGDQFYSDEPRTVLVQPDGKIVVCGQIADTDNNGDRAFFLARYHPTGALDASFGTNGKIIGLVSSGEMVGNDIALQPDGKIIAVGYDFSSYGFAVHRYNANGTLDTSFGAGGVVITPIGEYANANSVAIQADGKIVLAGSSWIAGQSYSDLTVVRLLPDGSLDTSFGGTGKVITSFGSSSQAGRVIVQPDGKIVAVGSAFVGNNQGLALVRYNSDGSLDSGFGSGGKIIHGVFNISRFWLGDAALQPDGKIIASGHFSAHASGGGSWDSILRCNPNGSRDTSFAWNNAITPGNPSFGNGIALQTDGKLLAFGYENSGGNYRFAILRLNPNGVPDTGFGTNGRVTTPITSTSYAVDGAVQPDGKILAFGSTSISNTESDIAIVRYRGDAAVPRPAQFDFDGDGRSDISVFRPSDSFWYLNQSTNGFAATQWGFPTDRITPADFDGDSKTDLAVYRDGTWWLASSNNSYNTINFGLASDIPVPADYTGDGRADLAIYRNGTWWIQDLTNNQTQVVNFGLSTDKPVPADYDGDGLADQAVYRDGEWHLNRSTQGYGVVYWGLSSDKPVPADYDGDGKTDPAVYRDGTWYLLQSLNGWGQFNWGISSDIPAPADYDGDGRADAAVYRNGTWWILQSTSGVSVQQFGLANDKPVSAAFLP